MTLGLDPFGRIVGISFPAPWPPETFINGEDALARGVDCDEETEYPLETSVSRYPETDTETAACVCGPAGGYPGWVDRFSVQILIPIAKDWPGCVIGASSGARIAGENWPGEPGGWGAPFPAPFSYPSAPRCTHSELVSGGPYSASLYRVTFIFQLKCYSRYEVCSGCEYYTDP